MKHFFLLFALVLGLAALAAAAPPTVTGCSATAETIGVDRSESIKDAQLKAWSAVAKARIDALQPGDALLIFTIDADTLTNRPLFERALPQKPPPGATMGELIDFRNKVIAFRKDAASAIETAFRPGPRANTTDVFSLLDRVPADPMRHRQMLLFTDGLHANKVLNLERVALSAPAFPTLIQKLAGAHRWSSTTLTGVEVQVVLPSPDTNGQTAGPNDARILKEFYSLLARSLGGNLTSFDSYVKQGGVCAAKTTMAQSR